MKAPGITIKPLKQMNGGAGFNEVFFDDVRVPHEHVLGDVNEGWKVAITTLMNERVAIGSGGGGGGRGSVGDLIVARQRTRRQRRPARAPATRRPLHEDAHPEVPLDAHAHRRIARERSRGRKARSASCSARRMLTQMGELTIDIVGRRRGRRRQPLLAGVARRARRVTSPAAPTK